jgi:hypothetical protein
MGCLPLTLSRYNQFYIEIDLRGYVSQPWGTRRIQFQSKIELVDNLNYQ